MSSLTGKVDILTSSTSAKPCHQFSFAEIQNATNDFDDELVIGHGGFGKVYKGHIIIEETLHVVAIKRLDSMSNQGAPEFRTEIEMLSNLRHCHLVSLIGFCDDRKEMVLVYEYMPHGTLYHHLHKANTHLNWVQRLKIAIGAARGLDYLHTGVGTQHGVIHRDVKSSNILLDRNWAGTISDFGLSKLGPTNQSSSYVDTSVKGTFGYLDPEYFYTRKLTRKTDVFAFGVVLLELLSGRLPVDIRYGEENCSLVRWAQKCMKERKLYQMVASSIRESIFSKCLRQFVQVADRCLRSCPKHRPTMSEVVVSLQLLLRLQEKYDNSVGSSGKTGFTFKMHKYLGFSRRTNDGKKEPYKPTMAGLELVICWRRIKAIANKRLIDVEADDHQRKPLKCGETLTKEADDQQTPHKCGEMLTEDLKVFTYSELECAAKGFGFKTCLGRGRIGNVYKGWVDENTYSPSEVNIGLPVVIKRLRLYLPECPGMVELGLVLKRFSHLNLVKLIGYCLEDRMLFLVYEFIHNGNLDHCLRSGAMAQLTIVTRVKMVLGIARGLVFLHKAQDEFVLSPSWNKKLGEYQLERCNILLDEDYTTKLSGYDEMKLAPYYFGKYDSCESDSFSDLKYKPLRLRTNLMGFTVVFTEILTGKFICERNGLETMNASLHKEGILKKSESLVSVAKLCFEICNDVDSESKMLRVLEKFKKLKLESMQWWI